MSRAGQRLARLIRGRPAGPRVRNVYAAMRRARWISAWLCKIDQQAAVDRTTVAADTGCLFPNGPHPPPFTAA
ncbi:hypothetical protein P7K49_013151 [Saguinus oedipus]|uniref:Uncharacterized protein n=1 Tax=Saguinus oedipus TaxID=9490 RepID=A0ABQ9VFC5_SAGOE|nr:hypothetical protein P7K49_013151 [Saguinus oedipus]